MKADPNARPNLCLRVDVARQTLHLLSNGAAVKSWPVSTSKFGGGTEPGSMKTPLGRFRICEKIGAGAPAWSAFKDRKPTGEIGAPGTGEDGILSRILWLEGLDAGNENTRSRHIYLHGTNQEHLIGSPASHGCVRLRNDDIIELFRLVPSGTTVEIA
ncbi:MAG: L,D-transpeptidase [Verrucomicrobiae bacterium]